MSCYEWERGEIVLPRAEYAKFKGRIRDAYNKSQTAAYDQAVEVRDKMLSARKSDKSTHWRDLYTDAVSGMDNEIRGMIYHSLFHGGFKKPLVPRKKDFAVANVRTKIFNADFEATVSFDDKSRRACWDVAENNRACECARDSVLGKAFFDALHHVSWTRGSGGKIIGNDEYNRDADYEGGGGNYVKGEWGPNVKRGLLR